MDKQTLSNYGWVIITVLVLAVMIALATPFGTYIKDAVKSTTEGMFSVSENALNKGLGEAGVTVNKAEFNDVPTVNGGNTNTPQIGDVRTFSIKCWDAKDDSYNEIVSFDKVFTYEYGMTWGDWVESDYSKAIYDEEILSASPNPQKLFYLTSENDAEIMGYESNAICVEDSYMPIFYETDGTKHNVLNDMPIDESTIYNAHLSWIS